jgi:hypothetical protein
MIHLDLSENEVCNIDNYRESIYEALPNVQVLDGKDRDGTSYISHDNDDDEYGEEGEFDIDDDMQLQEIINKLDPETR